MNTNRYAKFGATMTSLQVWLGGIFDPRLKYVENTIRRSKIAFVKLD